MPRECRPGISCDQVGVGNVFRKKESKKIQRGWGKNNFESLLSAGILHLLVLHFKKEMPQRNIKVFYLLSSIYFDQSLFS